ncbi:hypothetical protein CRUP_037704 [Coryphaenoides rupestris]|nr:hypothetical protein CRUP_037704 [Coryphaenoides rupestris]
MLSYKNGDNGPSIVLLVQTMVERCPAEESGQDCHNPFSVFQGCMRLLTLDNRPVDLIKVQQRLLGNYSHLQIDMCGIVDRRAYVMLGYIFREMVIRQYTSSRVRRTDTKATEEQTWMVMQHNNTELTVLRPSPGRDQYYANFAYASEKEQLTAIISQSVHCEQELSYYCRKSRLLNTPEGPAFSWWIGGPSPGVVQTHWGGAVPGSQQCACGLQENCLHPKHFCNCDADQPQWANDSGLLTNKETLPLWSLVLGDIQRPGSEAAYRSYWNAVSFDTETSYLHFPTFHAELSADISFLFKTTASSGVFLENLGIKDFIRIELSCKVLFSLDVGDGPLRVRVDSGVPLNDRRWHAVRAERNVKEAWLRVDALPPATLEAPADGHIHLQLNSQLFIGGTASRQKGFRGCLRSLQLNGVPLDLEERASITPGVRPGCPGHCSSYGALCLNGGRCQERPRGFVCDCGPSAYTGTFCHQELSASFTSSTAVHYDLRDRREQGTRDQSSLPSSARHPDEEVTLSGEEVSLSFRTSQRPALLLLVSSSHHQEYLALLISQDDKVEVRYKLHGGRDVEVLRSAVANLANGHLHTATVTRLADTVSIQVDQHVREDFNLTSDVELNAVESLALGRVQVSSELDPDMAALASKGFTGCLSGVHFNSVSPLKAALLHPDTSPVSVTGLLAWSDCGAPPPDRPYTAETTHSLSEVPERAKWMEAVLRRKSRRKYVAQKLSNRAPRADITDTGRGDRAGAVQWKALSSRVSEALCSGVSEALCSGVSEALCSGVSEALCSGVSEALCSGVSEALCSGVSEALCNGVSEVLCSGVSEALCSGVSEALCNGVSEALCSGVSEALCSGVSEALCSGVSEALCSGVSEALCSKVYGVLCSGVSQRGRQRGLIAVVIFACLSALAVAVRLLCRRRDTLGGSADMKAGRAGEEPPMPAPAPPPPPRVFPYNGRADSENVSFESPKEFFI